MPTYSAGSQGQWTHTVPANAQNVRFWVGGAQGGASRRSYNALPAVSGWHGVTDPTNWGAWSSFMNDWAVWVSPNSPNPTNSWQEAIYSMHVPYPSGNVTFNCQADNTMQIHIEAPGVQGWQHIISHGGFTSTHVHTRYMVHGTWHVKLRVYNSWQPNNAWHENPAGGAFTIYKDGNMIKNSRDFGGQIGSNSWDNSGGFGRYGSFNLDTRTNAYNLTFYIGGKGGDGLSYRASGEGNPGGGGGSNIASGGNGFSCGGGGGGASAVYDSHLNRYIVVAGGGGGAGRLTMPEYYAGLGFSGGGSSSSPSFRSGDNASAGNTGGGGGGTNWHNLGIPQGSTNPPYIGYGGASYWYGYVTPSTNGSFTGNGGLTWNGPGTEDYDDGSYILMYDDGPPILNSFTASSTNVQSGTTVTLSWDTDGQINNVQISPGVCNPCSHDGSISVTPPITTTYTIQVSGNGGTVSQSVTVNVYVPPVVTITASDTTIAQGESVTLTWNTTGDADTATLNPGFGSVPLNSTTTVAPTTTTTYTISVSGSGGTDSKQITITVQAPPTAELSVSDIDYNQTSTLTYNSANALTVHTIQAKEWYMDGTYSVFNVTHNLPLGVSESGSVVHNISYTSIGPFRIDYILTATNDVGQTAIDEERMEINIDISPDAIVIPPSPDKQPEEEPVISPDISVTTDEIEITDVDIPVEIKANQPVKVMINDNGTYLDVRPM